MADSDSETPQSASPRETAPEVTAEDAPQRAESADPSQSQSASQLRETSERAVLARDVDHASRELSDPLVDQVAVDANPAHASAWEAAGIAAAAPEALVQAALAGPGSFKATEQAVLAIPGLSVSALPPSVSAKAQEESIVAVHRAVSGKDELTITFTELSYSIMVPAREMSFGEKIKGMTWRGLAKPEMEQKYLLNNLTGTIKVGRNAP
jgi:hypothetical protein